MPAEGAPTLDGGAALVFPGFVEHNPFAGAAPTSER
jgi:hypothetical protein